MLERARIKATSCLLRQPEKFNLLLEQAIENNARPRAGDIVFARCLSSDGFETQIENEFGLMTRLYKGDVFVAVLADRKSGYAASAEMPKGPIARGDELGLIYRNGVAAIPICIPPYIGSYAMRLEVLGFARGKDGGIANLSDVAPIDPSEWDKRQPRERHIIFVAGTSSECGKTTFAANLNLSIKRQYPNLRTSAIKACGTGSNRDKQAMLNANYDCGVDFVDFGLATTYEIDPRRYNSVLAAMLNFSQAHSDLVVVEIGGDFLEANAPEALRLLASLGASCVLQVNDAMGAIEGLRRLRELGLSPLAVGCFRQNLASLRDRLGAEGHGALQVMDNRNESDMDALVAAFVAAAFVGHEQGERLDDRRRGARGH